MSILGQLGLREDPFGPANEAAGTGLTASLITACDDVLTSIREREALTIVVGRAGFGKTLLFNIVERRCVAEGLKIHRIARGDMAHAALSTDADLLLIDEADTIIDSTLAALAPGGENAAAPMMLFACVRPRLHRLPGSIRPAMVELMPLDAAESRGFLETRATAAGRPDLFEPEALDAIVRAGRGSPRLLRVLAGTAMFQAASDGSARIGSEHADFAVTLQHELQLEADPVYAANDADPAEQPQADELAPQPVVVPLARAATRRRRSDRRKRDLVPLAASVALAALVLPSLLSFNGSGTPPGTGGSVIAAGTSPAVARLTGPFAASAAHATPTFIARPMAGGGAWAERPTAAPPFLNTAPVQLARLDVRQVPPLASKALVQDALPRDVAALPREVRQLDVVASPGRMLLIDVLAATRPQPPAFAALRRGDGRAPAADNRIALASSVPDLLAAPDVAAPETPTVVASLVSLVKTAVDTASDAIASVEQAAAAREAASQASAAKDAADQAAAAKQAAEAANEAKQAADQAAAARQAADQAQAARDASAQAQAAKEAAEQAKAAKEAAEQAKGTKDAADLAQAAKEAAEQAKAAKAAADQAKAVKEAADQAQAAKEAAEQAKAARDAADQAKAAKEAAEQTKSAKEAAEQAKAAKEAAEQAQAARDAAEQAKAAKEAADQAQAAKEAAEQARAAKEAAEQAKAAKDAAEQAKAAKDAAEQAKAAKDAADQAKAAKEAADLAQAAKDAADQAKAAKDAADQAKAAKDTAQAAKDAKDAADQAKAAKDAVQTAKDAKDAAKAAKEDAKAAKDAAKGGNGG